MKQVAGPLYGWRAWRVCVENKPKVLWAGQASRPALRACVYHTEWAPPFLEATCRTLEFESRMQDRLRDLGFDDDDEDSTTLFGTWIGLMHSSAPHDDSQVPFSRGCLCGVHAYRNLDAMEADPEGPYTMRVDRQALIGRRPSALGIVSMWGRTQVHAAGYRSQFARPEAIVLDVSVHDAARGLALKYEVPVGLADFGHPASVWNAVLQMNLDPNVLRGGSYEDR